MNPSMSTERVALTTAEIRRRVADYEWYHAIDLGDGVVTPGQYDLGPLLPHYGLPHSLAGKSVLDVGPAHGFFAFELERRGASVATAELPNWAEHDASPILQETFAHAGDLPEAYHRGAFGFAIQARRSLVHRHFCNVYDLTPERVGTYDLVFCASVLLHLTDPLRALFGIRKVCRDQAIICTGIDNTSGREHESRALFVGQANGQAFWLPTIACLERMILAAGFARFERVSTFSLKSVDGRFDTPHGTVRAFVA
jgi:2-polyprenyl-3-methyl-5-hydroxy-6-metoxy-1,4-benzoquinol methylase